MAEHRTRVPPALSKDPSAPHLCKGVKREWVTQWLKGRCALSVLVVRGSGVMTAVWRLLTTQSVGGFGFCDESDDFEGTLISG